MEDTNVNPVGITFSEVQEGALKYRIPLYISVVVLFIASLVNPLVYGKLLPGSLEKNPDGDVYRVSVSGVKINRYVLHGTCTYLLIVSAFIIDQVTILPYAVTKNCNYAAERPGYVCYNFVGNPLDSSFYDLYDYSRVSANCSDPGIDPSDRFICYFPGEVTAERLLLDTGAGLGLYSLAITSIEVLMSFGDMLSRRKFWMKMYVLMLNLVGLVALVFLLLTFYFDVYKTEISAAALYITVAMSIVVTFVAYACMRHLRHLDNLDSGTADQSEAQVV